MLPLVWGATPDEHARPYPADPAEPASSSTSRIVCRLAVSSGGFRTLRAHARARGDLVMMRRQLHTPRDLAERDARSAEPDGPSRAS